MRRALVGVLLVSFGAVTATGQIWSPVGPDLFPALCGAISLSNPQVAVVAVSKRTTAILYFTTDRGSNWSTTADPLIFRPLAITFAHGSDSVLYVAAGDVFRSTDRGLTWSQLATPDGTVWLNLALNPTDSGEVWLAGYSDANAHGRASAAVSTDAGATWTMHVCDSTLRSSAHSIALDPTRDSTLYCGGSIAGRAVVYKSTDEGASWAVHDLPSSVVTDSIATCSPPAQDVPVLGRVRFLYVDPLNTGILLAAQPWYGVCRSTDAGVTWTHILGINEAHSMACSSLQPEVVYIGLTNGIRRTDDAGANWHGLYQPPYGGVVDCIMAFSDSVWKALATNGAGVLRTTGQWWGGWESFATLDTVVVTALNGCTTTPQCLYTAIADVGIFRSMDWGILWSRCGSFIGSESVVSLAANASDVWALADTGLYYSTNGGGAWTLKGDWFDSAQAVSVSPTLGDIILATGQRDGSLAVSVSSDCGDNWHESLLCAGGTGRTIAFSPVQAGRVLVGGDSAGSAVVFMTRDTGRTWLRAGNGVSGDVRSLAFEPSGGRRLYCGASDGSYYSSDTGWTWQYTGLTHVNSIVYASSWELLAGTDSGIFLNQGAGWQQYSAGLVDSGVVSLAVWGGLFAGTRTAGLFQSYFPVGLDDRQIDARPPPSAGPTVARNAVYLREGVGAGPVLLIDACGRRVMVLHQGPNDVRALAPGVYFVRGEGRGAGDVGPIRKVVLTR